MSKPRYHYIPGLISLIGLPILLIIFNPGQEPRQNVIRLRLPAEDTRDSNEFSRAFIDSFTHTKKIEQLYLDNYQGSEYLKKSQLKFIEREVQRIQFTHDTSMILQIKIGETGTFGNFISLINIATLYHVQRFVLYDDQFYFYANNPPDIEPNPEYLDAGQNVNGTIPEFFQDSKWDHFYWKIKYRFENFCLEARENLLLIIAFILLIFIPGLLHLFKTRTQ